MRWIQSFPKEKSLGTFPNKGDGESAACEPPCEERVFHNVGVMNEKVLPIISTAVLQTLQRPCRAHRIIPLDYDAQSHL